MKRPQRTYTPELRAEVLALLKGGAPVKRIARDKKLPESTVRWWREHAESAAPAEMRLKAETDIASQVDQLRRLYIERAGDDKAVATTSGYYAVMAAAKLTEVHQLLTGGATQRVDGPFFDLLTEIRDMRKPPESPENRERKPLDRSELTERPN